MEYLKVLQVFKGEKDFTVWTDICAAMGTLSTLVSHTDFQGDSYEWVTSIRITANKILSDLADRAIGALSPVVVLHMNFWHSGGKYGVARG